MMPRTVITTSTSVITPVHCNVLLTNRLMPTGKQLQDMIVVCWCSSCLSPALITLWIKSHAEAKAYIFPFPICLTHLLQSIFSLSSVRSSLGQGKWHSADTCIESLGASMVGTSMKQKQKEDLLQFSVTFLTKRHLHSLQWHALRPCHHGRLQSGKWEKNLSL